MHETPEDLKRVQALLDLSYEKGGAHLLSIHTPDRRMTAEQISDELTGMRLLSLATSTGDGRPIVGAVDGLFYRGDFWFGSGTDSLRFQHVRQRPAVSAIHLPGEHLAITVDGRAVDITTADQVDDGFAEYCISVYGKEWRSWGAEASYARIEADRMFTFSMPLPG